MLETDGTDSALTQHLVRHVILAALVEITAALCGPMIATAVSISPYGLPVLCICVWLITYPS